MAAAGTAGRDVAAGAPVETGAATDGTGPVAAGLGLGLRLPGGGTTCWSCDMSRELVGREVAPMPWAMPGAGPVVIMSRGTMRTARTPPYAD